MPAPEDDIMPIGERFELPFLVPYYCQFCSPELVLDIISGRVRAEDDPRWAWRACGIACLKMAIEALGGPMRPMMYWIEAALAIDGFIQERRAQKGKPSGWIHRSLAELGRQNGLVGECRAPVDTEEIARCLDRRQVVIGRVGTGYPQHRSYGRRARLLAPRRPTRSAVGKQPVRTLSRAAAELLDSRKKVFGRIQRQNHSLRFKEEPTRLGSGSQAT